jgi:hypothetical protein
MQEWFNWQSWKDCERATAPRVRIPLSPPSFGRLRIVPVIVEGWWLGWVMVSLSNRPSLSAK